MQVTKIIEGGIDLTTGTELELGIVISNGVRELMIPIDTPTLQILTVMVAEANMLKDPTPKKGIGMVPEDFEKKVDGCTCSYNDSEEMTAHAPLCALSEPLETTSAPAPRLVETEFEPERHPPGAPADDEEGLEPGEEYNDVGTGASSL